jgi:hypothetical protein
LFFADDKLSRVALRVAIQIEKTARKRNFANGTEDANDICMFDSSDASQNSSG